MASFLLDELATAASRGEIVALFQPQIELATGTVVATEALSRWRHPRAGLIPPDDFIATAESSGAIVEIERRMLRLACASTLAWERRGIVLDVSVNVALGHAAEPGYVDDVHACLAEAGLEPGRLTLEVTESQDPRAFGAALDHLRALAADGIAISVDDFGTGFAEPSVLDLIPASELKIDRSLMRPDAADAARTAALHAVDRGLRLVAEGVETEEQRDLARSIGCERAQGFLWSPPVEPAAITTLASAPTLPGSGENGPA